MEYGFSFNSLKAIVLFLKLNEMAGLKERLPHSDTYIYIYVNTKYAFTIEVKTTFAI